MGILMHVDHGSSQARSGRIAVVALAVAAVIAATVAVFGWAQASQHHARAVKHERAANDAVERGEQLERQRREARALLEVNEAELETVRDLYDAARANAEATGESLRYQTDLATLYERMLKNALSTVARHYREEGRAEDKAVLDAAADRARQRTREPYHSGALALAEKTLADGYRSIGDGSTAEKFLRLAVTHHTHAHGADHPETISLKKWLAVSLQMRARWHDAIELYLTAAEFYDRHPELEGIKDLLDSTMSQLIGLYRNVNDPAEAEQWSRRQLELHVENGELMTTRSAANAASSHAASLQALGKFEEAEQLTRKLLDLRKQLDGEESGFTLGATCRLAWLLRLQGRDDEADVHHTTLIETAQFMRQTGSPIRSQVFARYLLYLGEYEQAEFYLLRYLSTFDSLAHVYWYHHPSFVLMVEIYEAWGKPEEAARYREQIRVAPDPT